jgi:uncharacterized protein YndB with AHSA1/START domain
MPLHQGNKRGSAAAASILTIKRIFDAPREQVWKAWTEPERMKLWWAPKPFTAPVIKNDFRVGGRILGDWRSPDGKDMWSTGVYREIKPMERIVSTDSFADENGNVVPATRYGLGADFPLELLLTVTFEEKGGKTAFTLKHEGLPADEMLEARKGWMTSLDQLAESLAAKAEAGAAPETSFAAEPGSQAVVATRFFAIPPERVFRVLTDPALSPPPWRPWTCDPAVSTASCSETPPVRSSHSTDTTTCWKSLRRLSARSNSRELPVTSPWRCVLSRRKAAAPS